MRCVMAMFLTRRNCVVRFITVDVIANTFAKFLWSPYGIRQTIIFSSCGFFLLISIFFPFLA